MKSRFTFLFALICLLFADSCSKSPVCWGDDANKSIIEKYYNTHDFPMCVEGYIQENEYLIVRNMNELLNITDSNCYNLPEAGYALNPPEIDFNNFSLLGFWVTGQCETKFIRDVIKDEELRKYIYKIIVKDCGSCEKERYDANLILVPKLPDDFMVEFKKEDGD